VAMIKQSKTFGINTLEPEYRMNRQQRIRDLIGDDKRPVWIHLEYFYEKIVREMLDTILFNQILS
jgi:hypothetical protein